MTNQSMSATDAIGKCIDDVVAPENRLCFQEATERLIKDDSASIRCRFGLKTALQGADGSIEPGHSTSQQSLDPFDPSLDVAAVVLEMDGNGILIHDRLSGSASHVS